MRRLPWIRGWGSVLAVAGGMWLAGEAVAGTRWAVLEEPATVSTPAARPFLLAAARAGDRLVAAGERGIVFLSDDHGQTWRQAAVPVNVTLTAVRFATPKVGWAVGHYGVVLHTEDGGETWRKQLDGVAAARLVLNDALETAGGGRHTEEVRSAERLVGDGPDKPLLDILILGERSALVVGAYGLAFRTDDGGARWVPCIAAVENPGRLHLNAITTLPDGNAYMVGEQGTVLRSRDGGRSFEAVSPPYEGSFFAVLATSAADLLIVGLRGNLFQSADGGDNWTKVDLPTGATLTSAIQLRDGAVLLADQSGQLFRRAAGAARFEALPARARLPIAGLVEAASGTILAVGPAGVLPIYSSLSK